MTPAKNRYYILPTIPAYLLIETTFPLAMLLLLSFHLPLDVLGKL